MARWRSLGLLLLAGAAASLGWGAVQGDLQMALFLVFPVVYGSGPWGVLGILLLMGAFAAFAADAVARFPGPAGGGAPRRAGGQGDWADPDHGREHGREGHRNRDPWSGDDDAGRSWSGGGVIMLGPIPIVLGSDRRTTMILMGLAVLLTALGLAWWVLVGP